MALALALAVGASVAAALCRLWCPGFASMKLKLMVRIVGTHPSSAHGKSHNCREQCCHQAQAGRRFQRHFAVASRSFCIAREGGRVRPKPDELEA